MTPDDIALALALGSCSYPSASAQKRFARNMADIARLSPDKELSERQRHYMQLMAWRYRRQLPAQFVPLNKPADLAPKPKAVRKQGPSKSDVQGTLL